MAIAGVVPGEDGHVAVVAAAGGLVAFFAGAFGYIAFAAYDGLESGFIGHEVEVHGAVHIAVVGYGEGVAGAGGQGLEEFGGAAVAVADAQHAVKQRVLGVVMQMYETWWH